ncbi:hypothetical protein Bca101_083172 [Brassica carinata]
MSSYGESTISGDPKSSKAKGDDANSSSGASKHIGKPDVSSGLTIGDPHSKKPNGPMIHTAKTGFSSGVRDKAAVSSGVRGKVIVSENVGDVMSFRDVTFGPHEGEGTVIQGFIPPGRIETYLPHMKAGAIYRLNKFFGSKNKTLYRVADPSVTITFSWNSVLFVLEDSLVRFPEDRFRFHGYKEFEAACNLKGDLYGKFSPSLHPITNSLPRVSATQRQPKGYHLLCKKCGKSEIVGVPQYLSKISVYDNNDLAVFVLLGDAGQELTGKKASELVESYFEANESVGDDNLVPVPQALIDTIGRTQKFIVKVSNHNLTGKTQSLTVTKVLPPEAVEPVGKIEEDVIVPNAQENLQMGVADDGPSTGFEESVGEREKRAADMVEAEEPKRAKCG